MDSTTQEGWFTTSEQTVQQATETHSSGVDCPDCATALTDRADREIQIERFVDPLVADDVEGDRVEIPGWYCESCDVIVPVSRPHENLPFDPATWRPVAVEFDDASESRWVPVRRDAFIPANPNEERPLVVHVDERYDEFIGRGPDEATLANTTPGEQGWLGNPFQFQSNGGSWPREDAVAMYVQAVFQRLDEDPEFGRQLASLKGSRLGCECRYSDEEEPLCHGDALADIVERL
jgi:hypothetical protein